MKLRDLSVNFFSKQAPGGKTERAFLRNMLSREESAFWPGEEEEYAFGLGKAHSPEYASGAPKMENCPRRRHLTNVAKRGQRGLTDEGDPRGVGPAWLASSSSRSTRARPRGDARPDGARRRVRPRQATGDLPTGSGGGGASRGGLRCRRRARERESHSPRRRGASAFGELGAPVGKTVGRGDGEA